MHFGKLSSTLTQPTKYHDRVTDKNKTVLQIEPKDMLTNKNFKDTKHKLENTIYIVKPTRCTNVSNLFYFGMTL